jgi:hypothetical protein
MAGATARIEFDVQFPYRLLMQWFGAASTIAAAVAFVLTGGCGKDSYDLDGGDLVVVGDRFVAQRGCPSCHQPTDREGTLAGQSMPRPASMAYGANLTPDLTTGIGGWADIEIVRAMRYGIDDEGQPLCPPMPHFDGSDPAQVFMTDLEASAIVAYLRSLSPVSAQVPSSMCPPLKPAPPIDMAAPGQADLATHD